MRTILRTPLALLLTLLTLAVTSGSQGLAEQQLTTEDVDTIHPQARYLLHLLRLIGVLRGFWRRRGRLVGGWRDNGDLRFFQPQIGRKPQMKQLAPINSHVSALHVNDWLLLQMTIFFADWVA